MTPGTLAREKPLAAHNVRVQSKWPWAAAVPLTWVSNDAKGGTANGGRPETASASRSKRRASIRVSGQQDEVIEYGRLDNPEVSTIQGEDASEPKTLRSSDHRSVGESQRQIVVLPD